LCSTDGWLSFRAVPIAILRGFIVSGTSRTSSIMSMPFSKLSALHLNVVRQIEHAPEGTLRDAAVEVLVAFFLSLTALDCQHALLGRDGDVFGSEASNGKRDPVVVLADALDVVGG
jgi:hypothetical protein